MKQEFDVYKEPRWLCCICGRSFLGYGHNPNPYRKEGQCCADCNREFVIPARLKLLKEKKED